LAFAVLPTSLDQYRQQIAEKAGDPKAALKLWFDGVYVYLLVDKELGQQCILEMDRWKEWDSRSFRTFRSQIDSMPYIMYSYAKGATPQNGYKFDPNNYELVFHGAINTKPFADKPEGDFVKMFIRSGGADLPRPLTMQRNNLGQYKMYEFSSLYVGVRPPETARIFGDDIPESTDPVWTFKHWLQGILMYLAGDEAGLQQMNALMKEPDENLHSFHGTLTAEKAYIWRSYVVGATPENQYSVPDITNFEVSTYFQPGEEPTDTAKRIRMFVRSSGADSARPMILERDDRLQWRMSEYSSLCVGVRKPVDPNAGNF